MKIIETTEKMIFISIFLSLIFLTGSLSDVAKVKVSLYYESLCPWSAKYISEQLYPTYRKLGRHIDLDYIPYGNAEMTYHPSNSSYTFDCQHGPEECLGNKIQGCLRHGFNDTSYDATLLQLQIVDCIMGTANFGRLFHCMEELYPGENFGPLYEKILDCATGSEGTNILAEMGNDTMVLTPPNEHVPWVTVDGKHEDKAEENLSQFLCKEKLMNISECKRKSMKGDNEIWNPNMFYQLEYNIE